MSQTLLEMTKDLVLAQIATRHVPPEALADVLHNTYATLRGLETAEAAGAVATIDAAPERAAVQVPVDWKRSIGKNSITCLECGDTFKQLSLRHLTTHDLDPRSYRAKYNIPRSQALSARATTARRRELAQEIRPWELAPGKTAAVDAVKGNGAEAKASGSKASAKAKTTAKSGAGRAASSKRTQAAD